MYKTKKSSQLGETRFGCIKRFSAVTVVSRATEQFRLFITTFFFVLAVRPDAGHGLLIHEVSRSHTTTQRSL
jgi:hypothetical protein